MIRNKKFSHAARAALLRQNPQALGVILSSFEEDILEALKGKFSDVVANIGMQEKRILTAIGKAAYYYKKGYSRARDKAKALRDMIAKDMKATAAESTGILRLLLMLEAIQKPEFPLLATYLSPQTITASTVAQAAKATVSQTAEKAADHLKQVAKETVSDAGKLVSSAVDTVNAAAPWYLKPKLLIPLALAGVLLFYGAPLLKAAQAARPRPRYLPNPIPATRAQAKRKYKEFHAKEAKKTISVPKIDTTELVELGKALEIGYRSKKWEGKANNYLHKFGKGVRLCSTADGKALVLVGGKLDTTDRGIVG